jgi:hypothetical protein
MSPPGVSSGRDRVTLGVIAVLGFAAVLLIASPVFRATLMLEQVNEGWDGRHALNAFSWALYPAKPALILNNYPPLWFYLTGWLGRVFGDPIFPGRWVAFAAFAAVALEIFVLCRRLGVGVPASVVGTLGSLVTVEAFYSQYVGLAEPQMLAHALATGAAAVLVGARSKAAVRVAALVTVAALMVKQVVVGLPIACTLWLLLRRRSLALTWISTGLYAGVAAAAALLLAYGGPLLENVMAPRYLTWERFGTNLALVQRPIVSVVAFAVTAYRLRRQWDEAMLFAALAIGAAFVPMAVFGSALGVSINIGLDLAIAASIGLAVAWQRAELAFGARYAGLWRGLLTASLLLLAAAQLPRNGALDVFEPGARSRLIANSTALMRLRDRIAGLKGPVACETLAICVWAKHPTEADLWKLRHERTLAFLDARPLVAQVEAGGYAAVTTLGPVAIDGVQTPGLAAALARSYQPPILYAGMALYLPKHAP